jgi:serine/threonine protein kinase
MKGQAHKPKVAFSSLYPKADPLAVELLDRMLMFNPAKRITVEEALAHPYLESLHNDEDEPVADSVFSFEFEKEDLTRERLQEMIFDECCYFHPEAREEEEARNKEAGSRSHK